MFIYLFLVFYFLVLEMFPDFLTSVWFMVQVMGHQLLGVSKMDNLRSFLFVRTYLNKLSIAARDTR